jgi:hypothetical protein
MRADTAFGEQILDIADTRFGAMVVAGFSRTVAGPTSPDDTQKSSAVASGALHDGAGGNRAGIPASML